jgi:hypothetical protein
MPEAPWIRRWGSGPGEEDATGGIKFTDNILQDEGEEDEEGANNEGTTDKPV